MLNTDRRKTTSQMKIVSGHIVHVQYRIVKREQSVQYEVQPAFGE